MISKFNSFVATCLLVFPMASLAAPITVNDAGFETPDLGTGPAAFAYNPIGSAWNFSSTGLAANGSLFLRAQVAPEGDQVAFLQNAGTFSQTFTGLGAGTYTVSFLAAQRERLDDITLQTINQTFDVFLGGVLMGSFEPGSIAFASFSTNSVSLAAGDHDLVFVGTNLNGSADATVFIDSVSMDFNPVPVSATLPLLAIGLFGIKRRARNQP